MTTIQAAQEALEAGRACTLEAALKEPGRYSYIILTLSQWANGGGRACALWAALIEAVDYRPAWVDESLAVGRDRPAQLLVACATAAQHFRACRAWASMISASELVTNSPD